MQATTTQPVPVGSSLLSQKEAEAKPNPAERAPLLLDAEALRQVSGGITKAPRAHW